MSETLTPRVPRYLIIDMCKFNKPATVIHPELAQIVTLNDGMVFVDYSDFMTHGIMHLKTTLSMVNMIIASGNNLNDLLAYAAENDIPVVDSPLDGFLVTDLPLHPAYDNDGYDSPDETFGGMPNDLDTQL